MLSSRSSAKRKVALLLYLNDSTWSANNDDETAPGSVAKLAIEFMELRVGAARSCDGPTD